MGITTWLLLKSIFYCKSHLPVWSSHPLEVPISNHSFLWPGSYIGLANAYFFAPRKIIKGKTPSTLDCRINPNLERVEKIKMNLKELITIDMAGGLEWDSRAVTASPPTKSLSRAVVKVARHFISLIFAHTVDEPYGERDCPRGLSGGRNQNNPQILLLENQKVSLFPL